ncbi:MAG: ROK family protein [Acutalibacteraceae bacterium]|nr:ROK family protein [Acutalibacteraceae bacterium]
MYRLGIDLGGTNIVAAVVDENYNIIGRGKVKTALPRPADEICDSMAEAARIAVAEAGLKMEDISAMGIGTPGAVDPSKGIVTYANNLGFANTPLCAMMKERTGVEFYLENDANAAAYGEFLAGAGKGTKDFMAVTLGTGVGGGIIINGKLFSGSNYAGGELGHTVINVNGEQCSCGRKGCWEAYASATALIRQTKAKMLENKDSVMWELAGNDIDKVNGRVAWDAWRKGDKAGSEVVEAYCQYVAEGVTNMLNIFQPEMLCIGGGISNEKDNLIIPVNRLVNERIYTRNTDKSDKVCVAALGNDAGIIGAAFLDRLYK